MPSSADARSCAQSTARRPRISKWLISSTDWASPSPNRPMVRVGMNRQSISSCIQARRGWRCRLLDDQRLRNVMSAVLRVPAEEIHAGSSMDTIDTWDSLAHMNLVLAIEEEFGVSIPDDEAANVTS